MKREGQGPRRHLPPEAPSSEVTTQPPAVTLGSPHSTSQPFHASETHLTVPPRGAQEPAMFDRGTRGHFLRTLFPQNSTAEPGVGSCA